MMAIFFTAAAWILFYFATFAKSDLIFRLPAIGLSALAGICGLIAMAVFIADTRANYPGNEHKNKSI
jgi:hypothetical protein